MFTRDSMLWTLLIIGAGAAYLATMPAPWLWTWAQWMATVAALVGIVAAKLDTSPLKGAGGAK